MDLKAVIVSIPEIAPQEPTIATWLRYLGSVPETEKPEYYFKDTRQ